MKKKKHEEYYEKIKKNAIEILKRDKYHYPMVFLINTEDEEQNAVIAMPIPNDEMKEMVTAQVQNIVNKGNWNTVITILTGRLTMLSKKDYSTARFESVLIIMLEHYDGKHFHYISNAIIYDIDSKGNVIILDEKEQRPTTVEGNFTFLTNKYGGSHGKVQNKF